MKLTIIGGGGFRVPQIVEALSDKNAVFHVDEIALYDISTERLQVIEQVAKDLYSQRADFPKITVTTKMEEAITDSDFIFSAMRIGSTCGRIKDERTALEEGIIGQETIGPGGQAYALRTFPEALNLARKIKEYAPDAWTINFTNPAGVITQGMRTVLGKKVVGICDTPIGLMRKSCAIFGLNPETVEFDYVGLNHLGWLRTLKSDGTDYLPNILSSDKHLDKIEEARILGFDWVRALGMLPNEYLYYYYCQRESVQKISSSDQTRGEFLHKQQTEFYEQAAKDKSLAGQLWHQTHQEREATYMAESRDNEERREEDFGGGYQEVALNIMAAIIHNRPSKMILNVANNDLGENSLLIPQLREDAVVEVPCIVDSDGIHPQKVGPLTGCELGLVTTVKGCEELLIDAVLEKDPTKAWRAIGNHPLVDSIGVAKTILDKYLEEPATAKALGVQQ